MLDYCDPVDGETMVDVCLHGMANEYYIFLENLSFSFQIDGGGLTSKWVCKKDSKANPRKSSQSRGELTSKEEANFDRSWKEPGGEAFKVEEAFLYAGVQLEEQGVSSSSTISLIEFLP